MLGGIYGNDGVASVESLDLMDPSAAWVVINPNSGCQYLEITAGWPDWTISSFVLDNTIYFQKVDRNNIEQPVAAIG